MWQFCGKLVSRLPHYTLERVVQYTGTVTVRIIHVTIRTDRKDLKIGIQSVKGRTDRKSSIRSVTNFLRSVNCILLVGLRPGSVDQQLIIVQSAL